MFWASSVPQRVVAWSAGPDLLLIHLSRRFGDGDTATAMVTMTATLLSINNWLFAPNNKLSLNHRSQVHHDRVAPRRAASLCYVSNVSNGNNRRNVVLFLTERLRRYDVTTYFYLDTLWPSICSSQRRKPECC